MYPEHLVAPMRDEILEAGFTTLNTPEEVEAAVASKGTTLVFINSVCGCSARTARPGVKYAVQASSKKPDNLFTVFAGVEVEATARLRQLHQPVPPSSPSIALFKDGELIHFVERHHIEGRSAEIIGAHLEGVFEEVC
jgi:putative YphP/YqiW family bacilliredoxin